jgi:hypothetical protein
MFHVLRILLLSLLLAGLLDLFPQLDLCRGLDLSSKANATTTAPLVAN